MLLTSTQVRDTLPGMEIFLSTSGIVTASISALAGGLVGGLLGWYIQQRWPRRKRVQHFEHTALKLREGLLMDYSGLSPEMSPAKSNWY